MQAGRLGQVHPRCGCPSQWFNALGYHVLMASPDDVVLKPLRDAERGRRNLTALRSHLATDAFGELVSSLSRLLPRAADPDMALNNLERLLTQPAARSQLP